MNNELNQIIYQIIKERDDYERIAFAEQEFVPEGLSAIDILGKLSNIGIRPTVLEIEQALVYLEKQGHIASRLNKFYTINQ